MPCQARAGGGLWPFAGDREGLRDVGEIFTSPAGLRQACGKTGVAWPTWHFKAYILCNSM